MRPARAPSGNIPPGLYLVATPIGAARDITLRALDLLAAADVLVAEDTRTLRRLLEIHGVALNGRPLLSHHDHSRPGETARIATALADGKVVVFASDAGTPLVSDPGHDLVQAALGAGAAVHAAPGASAVLCALAVSGLPADRFFFAGFPPAQAEARRKFLAEHARIPGTLILYESPHRVRDMLADLAAVCAPGRRAVVARELTKRFETVERGTIADLAAGFAGREAKGEYVVLLDRPAEETAVDADAVDLALRQALATMRVADAATAVAGSTGWPRREVYRRALALGQAGKGA
jgi:16S rRNA (cytidine1402-2'-O)-methyltransferase